MDLTTATDGELLDRYLQLHDGYSFRLVVERHRDLVLGVCRALVDDGEPEDASQQVFTILATNAARLSRRVSLAGWLHRTAWHVSMRRRRASRRRRTSEAAAARLDRAPDPAEQLGLRMDVEYALSLLPDSYREVLVLHHLEGLTVDEVAERVGLRPGTAASRLSRGRALLQARLGKHGMFVSLPVITVVLGRGTNQSAPPLSTVIARGRSGLFYPPAVPIVRTGSSLAGTSQNCAGGGGVAAGQGALNAPAAAALGSSTGAFYRMSSWLGWKAVAATVAITFAGAGATRLPARGLWTALSAAASGSSTLAAALTAISPPSKRVPQPPDEPHRPWELPSWESAPAVAPAVAPEPGCAILGITVGILMLRRRR